jgi:hypothetical protein
MKTNLLILMALVCSLLCYSHKGSRQFFIDDAVLDKKHITKNFKNNSYNSFHFFTHGRSGELLIEGKWLGAEEIHEYLAQVLNTSNHLKVNKLYIYGCEFAKGNKGLEAVRSLERSLNIDIVASTDITGKDGNWNLEVGNLQVNGFDDYPHNLQDTDGDGVLDIVDIDDDNDGILDTEESDNRILTYSYSDSSPLAKDRKMLDELKRDFILGPSTLTLKFDDPIKISMNITVGDLEHAFRKSTISLDGDIRNLVSTAGNFKTEIFSPAKASNYVLKIGKLPVNHIEVFDVNRNQLVGFDLGTENSPVHPGYLKLFNTKSSSLSVKTSEDSDSDGIVDSLDLDSDNDGIPDNIEGQTTRGFKLYNPFTSLDYNKDSDGDGLIDRYDETPITGSIGSKGVMPEDTDEDGIPDFRDLDTDNDGYFDIDEAGIRLSNNDIDKDGRTDHFVGSNGLENLNGFEIADDYSDVDGLAFKVFFMLSDIDGDTEYSASAIPMTKDFDYRDLLDSDGDGLTDDIDLDDDNDGTVDADESISLPLTPLRFDRKFSNSYKLKGLSITQTLKGKAYNTGFDNNGNLPLSNGSSMLITTSSKSDFTISASTFDKAVNFDPGDFWRFETNTGSDFVIDSSKGIKTVAKGKGFIEIQPTKFNGTDWSITVSNVNSLKLILLIGNAISDLRVRVKSQIDIDDDGDGIVNRLDLDSDNDGIPDRTEAYASNKINNHSSFSEINSNQQITNQKNKSGVGYTASAKLK